MGTDGPQKKIDNRGNQYVTMAQNLLTNLQTKLVDRLDVNFHIKDKLLPDFDYRIFIYFRNTDSWIGRTAHIQFLECQRLMNMLVYRYRDFFT